MRRPHFYLHVLIFQAGVGATQEIRRIEADMAKVSGGLQRVRILALTGMSSLEDKRRAFEAGVDG
jgi:CheY-like chemotaxis protein